MKNFNRTNLSANTDLTPPGVSPSEAWLLWRAGKTSRLLSASFTASSSSAGALPLWTKPLTPACWVCAW